MRIDMTPQVCSQCGLTWSGFHMCITALKDRIAALEARCRAAEKILHDAGEESIAIGSAMTGPTIMMKS